PPKTSLGIFTPTWFTSSTFLSKDDPIAIYYQGWGNSREHMVNQHLLCIFLSRHLSSYIWKQIGSKDTKMVVGRLRTCKVVNLSSDSEEVAICDCVTRDLKGIPFNLLVPGMMVNASVCSTLENGIMLSFLTFFIGTVCWL
ncbi:hypothetical protein M8C21_015076, partial [Ambrosia artemisiifolia]